MPIANALAEEKATIGSNKRRMRRFSERMDKKAGDLRHRAHLPLSEGA
jgi:hypothetical protein